MSNDVPHASIFINNKPLPKDSSELTTHQVCHPHTQDVVSTFSSASSTTSIVNAAVSSCASALKSWESTPPSKRRDILIKAADLLVSDQHAYKKRIVEYAMKETGAVIAWAGSTGAVGAASVFKEAASLATHIRGETVQSETPGATFLVLRKACGVIFAIAPWNAPGNLIARAVAVPLICGNTVLLKSSEICPYTTSLIVEALYEAGLPPGVLNLVHGSRTDSPKLVAEAIANPIVRKINFTGSDRVGKIIAGIAAQYLKPCIFELGGKAPCVVLEDANIEDAARAIVSGSMLHSGQICMSTERVIAHEAIFDKLLAAVQSLTKKLSATLSSSSPHERLGPVFTHQHASAVVNMISEAKEKGAEIIEGDLTADGAVVKPHLVNGVQPGMRLWEQESFGPVVGFAKATSVEHAIELANNTTYSLTASLWSNSLSALQIAAQIRASSIVVNGLTVTMEPSYGLFGLGGSTGYGRFDIDHFTDRRAISVRSPGEKYPLDGL